MRDERARAPSPSPRAGPQQLADRDPHAAQRRLVAILQHFAQQQPLRRLGGHVAQQLRERALKRAGDLQEDEDRGVADAIFQVGQVPFGNVGRLRERFARHAAPRAQRLHPLAERDQERVLALPLGFAGFRRRRLGRNEDACRQYSA